MCSAATTVRPSDLSHDTHDVKQFPPPDSVSRIPCVHLNPRNVSLPSSERSQRNLYARTQRAEEVETRERATYGRVLLSVYGYRPICVKMRDGNSSTASTNTVTSASTTSVNSTQTQHKVQGDEAVASTEAEEHLSGSWLDIRGIPDKQKDTQAAADDWVDLGPPPLTKGDFDAHDCMTQYDRQMTETAIKSATATFRKPRSSRQPGKVKESPGRVTWDEIMKVVGGK